MTKSSQLILFIICITIFSQFSCNNPVTPPPKQNEQPKAIKLKLLYVSCTDAFIDVAASDTVLPVNISLTKDNNPLFNFTLTKTDTTVLDTNMQPGKTYVYQTTAEIKGKEEKSDTIQVKSLPTTSDNFIWQKYTFGNPNYGSNILRGVSIIDQNNIWVVGEIHNDTTGQAYNAIHWDGNKWGLKRISVMYNSNLITSPLYGVFAFSASDIWFSSGIPIHGDGTNWTQYHLFDMGILGPNDGYLTKIFGNSSSDIYYIGTLGTIVHYQNGQWIKIESGTNLNIHDINGFINPFTGKTEILCTADDPYFQQPVQVISIKENNTAVLLDNTDLGIAISSVWFSPGIRYYIVGNGLYEKTYKDSIWTNLNHNLTITQNFMESIRGNGINDIIVSGAYGEIIHFNGLRWKSIKDGTTTLNNGEYYSVAVKGNLVSAVGYDGGYGVILVGHRQ